MKNLTIFALAAALASPLAAQAPDLSVEEIGLVGGLVGLNWGPTALLVGGGWELTSIGRDLDTGLPLPASAPSVDLQVPDARLLVRQTWALDEGNLWAGGGLWGQGNFGFAPGGHGAFADRDGGLVGVLQAGATRKRLQENAHGVAEGTSVDLLVEAGPPVLSLRSTSYLRAEARTAAFFPLWDLEGEKQLFSGVLGLRANALWLSGDSVPLLLLQSTDVRGYRQYFDTELRSVATAELRVGLPSLWGAADLVPLVLGFGEGGWYQGYANAPASVSERSGWLVAAGLGLGIRVFGFVTPVLTVAVPLVGESGLWWKIGSNLAF